MYRVDVLLKVNNPERERERKGQTAGVCVHHGSVVTPVLSGRGEDGRCLNIVRCRKFTPAWKNIREKWIGTMVREGVMDDSHSFSSLSLMSRALDNIITLRWVDEPMIPLVRL